MHILLVLGFHNYCFTRCPPLSGRHFEREPFWAPAPEATPPPFLFSYFFPWLLQGEPNKLEIVQRPSKKLRNKFWVFLNKIFCPSKNAKKGVFSMLSPPKTIPHSKFHQTFFVPEEMDSKFGDFCFPRLFGLPPVCPNVRPPNIGKFDPIIDCFAASTTLEARTTLATIFFLGWAPLLPLIFGAYFSCLSFRRILVGKLGVGGGTHLDLF